MPIQLRRRAHFHPHLRKDFFKQLADLCVYSEHPHLCCISQQAPHVDPMLGQCWPSVVDAGPTLAQHRVNVSCSRSLASLNFHPNIARGRMAAQKQTAVTACFSSKLLPPFAFARGVCGSRVSVHGYCVCVYTAYTRGQVTRRSRAVNRAVYLAKDNKYVRGSGSGPVFSYKLRYIVGIGLVEMAIWTNPKPTIYILTCALPRKSQLLHG